MTSRTDKPSPPVRGTARHDETLSPGQSWDGLLLVADDPKGWAENETLPTMLRKAHAALTARAPDNTVSTLPEEGVREIVAELEALLAKATPGPWQSSSDAVRGDHDPDGWTEITRTPCPRSPHGSARIRQWLADATLIVAMRNHLPTILAALSRSPASGGAPSVEEVARTILLEERGWSEDSVDRHEHYKTTVWVVAQRAAEAILALFPTPPQSTAAGAEENAIGAAEREVGQFVYRRIEVLMNAQPETPEGRELTYLARIVSDVEEYGADGTSHDKATEFSTPAVPEREADRIASHGHYLRALADTLSHPVKAEMLPEIAKDVLAAAEDLLSISHLPAPEGEGDKGFGRTQERPSPSDGHGWLPIETAPKDGRRFLAFGGGLDRVETASWNEEVGCWECESVTLDDLDFEAEGYSRPTIWMHIPAAPETTPSTSVGEGSAERLPTEPNPSAPGSAEGWRPAHPVGEWVVIASGDKFRATLALTDREDARSFAAWAADLPAPAQTEGEG